jgi:hypothetical protein
MVNVVTINAPRPIACSLAPGEYPERIQEFRTLFASVVDLRREPTRLQLTFQASKTDPQHARDLLRREQECCPFFSSSVDVRGESVLVEIAVSPGAEEWLDDLQRIADPATLATRT